MPSFSRARFAVLALTIAAMLYISWANGPFFSAASTYAASTYASSTDAEGPSLAVTEGLQVNAGETVEIPLIFRSNSHEISGIGLSIDFDQNCLAFDNADADGDGVPDAISFGTSPQFFPSVSYDAQDTDGEIDIILADYIPPLATISDSDELIRIQLRAVCQPESAAGEATSIDFSQQPAISFSDSAGKSVPGQAIPATLLILPKADFTPEPTPTVTASPTPAPSPTATPIPDPDNRAPSVGNDSATTNEDSSATIDVLQNDSDPDGDALLVSQITQPRHGVATINADQTITYLPQTDFNGSDSFTYTASDERGGAVTATVNMTVRAVNDAPVILIAPGNQSNSVGEEVTLLISASDPDTDQALLTYSAEGLPPGLAIDSKSGLITGMVTDQAEGKYMAQLTVSDGELSDSVQFQWMVSPKQTPTLYLPIAPNR